MAVIALVAVLAMGTMSVSAGLGGGLDAGLSFFAQNGQGQENGNPPENPGAGNNGQGQGQENGNPPADPGSGNNGQGQGNPPADPGPGSSNQGEVNGNPPADAGEAQQQAQENPAPEKVNVCHVTGEDSGDTVMITISENAVPAHEAHGDTLIGVESAEECPDAPDADASPEATPEGEEGDEVQPVDGATPVATPEIG